MYSVHCTVHCTLNQLVYSTVNSITISTVQIIMLGTIYRRQGGGCSSGNKSSQAGTSTSGYNLQYSVQNSVQYILQCSV